MAYSTHTEGMEELLDLLKELGDKAESAAAYGVYDGAGVIADEIKAGAESIQTEPFHYTMFGTRAPSPEEKAAILTAGGAGIAKFEKTGNEVRTSVGYDNAGYADVNGKQKPIPLIANAINSGTSFMKKQPFFRKAVNRGKKRAESAIGAAVEAYLDQITKQSGG